MEIAVTFLLGLASGFISALCTGGGLLTIPGLILLGLPPVSAIATSRLGAVGAGLSSTIRYHKGKVIAWQYMPYFSILAVIAGLIGPHILLNLDKEVLERTIAIIMLALLPLLFLDNKVHAEIRLRRRTQQLLGTVLVFIILLYAVMFGGGSGILFIYVFTYIYGMKVIEANATCTVLGLIGSSVALFTYIKSGSVLFELAIPLSLGTMIGGYAGAHAALKYRADWIKWLLAVVIIISSFKLLFT